MQNKIKIQEIFFIFFMLLFLFILLFKGVVNESRVYDEVTYVNAGYGFLTKHDFRLDPFNPPFARELVALPMLFNSGVSRDPILFWPRMVVVVVTLIYALLIYFFAKKLFGKLAAVLALVIFVFDPNILAHGHYATMDMIFAFFFTLTLYLYFVWKKKFSNIKIILFSVVLGITLSTKISGLFFLMPSLMLIYILENKKWKSISFWMERKKAIILILITTLLTLWSTYFFTMEPALGYRFDPKRPAIKLAEKSYLVKLALTQPIPLGSYISTIKQQVLFNYSGWYRKDSYIFGNLSKSGHPGYYFPLVILVKTPVVLLLFFTVSTFYFMKKSKNYLILIIPFVLILISVTFTKIPLVLRYILPLYPLIILYSSQVINIKSKRKILKSIALVILLVWHISGALRVAPYYLSFTNEFFGGNKSGYKYVFDANWDWGQGLLDLKRYQDTNNISNLQLAYFGDLDPKLAGIRYERIRDQSLRDMQEIKSINLGKNSVIAISGTCWYLCGYYKDTRINYMEPYDIVGGSILIFRID